MKKSINAGSFPDSYTQEQVIAAAKRAGFDAIEFNFEIKSRGRCASFFLDTEDKFIEYIAKKTHEAGLEVVSVSSSLPILWSLKTQQAEELRVRALKKLLKIARIFGADTVLLVPGGMPEGMLLSEARKNSIEALKSVIPIIKESGITVGLENVGNFFFMSPYDVVSFLKELDSDVFASYLDLGNMLAFSKSEYWADVLAPYVKRVHIKDLKRFSYSKYGGEYCQLLEGDWDYKLTMQVLKRHGFDGYLTAELLKYDESLTDEEYIQRIADAEGVIIDYYNSI